MRRLARALADPASVLALDEEGWTAVLCMAHAERLSGTLAHRVEGLPVPPRVAEILNTARMNAAEARTRALWEVEMARRALTPLGVPIVLLKGSAFLAAELEAGQGRLVGDLDILVPRDALPEVEAALLDAGWEWLKEDAYDDHYYRTWMHELPPLIHRERDAMIDVHHTILPLTARAKPYPGDLIDMALPLGWDGSWDEDGRPVGGLYMLRPESMIVHAAAHLIADGDLSGGMRNLWDIDRLWREFSSQDDEFHLSVAEEAWKHHLGPETMRALRLSDHVFSTRHSRESGNPASAVGKGSWIPAFAGMTGKGDGFYITRLLARDGWGRETHRLLRFAFYIRSHLIRMPLPLLLRHLFTKWRKARSGA